MPANKFLIYFIALNLWIVSVSAQQVKFSGQIRDASSGERLIGASIHLPQKGKGNITNEYGYYTISLPQGEQVQLVYSFIGYEPLTINIRTEKDSVFNAYLKPLFMEEVVVVSERNIQRSSINRIKFTSPDLLEFPSLKPDVDILDVIQQQSGVQPGLEGSVGFSVRGGNNDQNLILMDNIPLYNTGHLAGFVSIFDPYAINSMTFYKGGFPARYGGRISSVLDIYLKEGDLKEYHGEANIGLFSGKLALEGPMVKDRSSFLLSFRRSTVDLFLRGIYAINDPESQFLYSYHDLNFKVNHRINEKNHLYFSLYSGGDNLESRSARAFPSGENVLREYSSSYLNDWGNRFLSFRWNSILNKGMFMNLTLAYSDFDYNLGSSDEILDNGKINFSNQFNYGVSVKDLVLKNDFDVSISNQFSLQTGVHLTAHHFQPVNWQQVRIEQEGFARNESFNQVSLNAFEGFLYLQSDISLLEDKLNIHPGLRWGKYFLQGGTDFTLWEPRFSINYSLSPKEVIHADYSRMSQTVHSLNSSGTALTPDIWIPVTERLKPAYSDQVSLSYSREFEKEKSSIQTGVFYKEMHNLIEYNQRSGFGTIRGNWDEEFSNNGFGKAYGIEISGDKQFDRIRIEGNYTLSRSVRRFADINQGAFYSQNFDRPHNITLTSLIKLNQKTTLSLLWTYQTGQPITLGLQTYQAINNHRISLAHYADQQENFNLTDPNRVFFEEVLLVDEMNNYRMPDYHRLDLGLNHRKRWANDWIRTVSVSIYNTYNRQNAYFIYTERNEETLKFYQFTLFPILPSVSYGLKF